MFRSKLIFFKQTKTHSLSMHCSGSPEVQEEAGACYIKLWDGKKKILLYLPPNWDSFQEALRVEDPSSVPVSPKDKLPYSQEETSHNSVVCGEGTGITPGNLIPFLKFLRGQEKFILLSTAVLRESPWFMFFTTISLLPNHNMSQLQHCHIGKGIKFFYISRIASKPLAISFFTPNGQLSV